MLSLETDLGLPLEDDHSATFIPSGQEISSLVKFHCRDDISWEDGTVQLKYISINGEEETTEHKKMKR